MVAASVTRNRLLDRFLFISVVFILYGRGFDLNSRAEDIWPSFVLSILTYRHPILKFTFCLTLSAAASMLYLMDWMVWYQEWPIPTVCGALVGSVIDHLLASLGIDPEKIMVTYLSNLQPPEWRYVDDRK